VLAGRIGQRPNVTPPNPDPANATETEVRLVPADYRPPVCRVYIGNPGFCWQGAGSASPPAGSRAAEIPAGISGAAR
jgi:hypothetical protein